MVAYTYKPSFWKDLNVEPRMDSISKSVTSSLSPQRDCVVLFVLVFLFGKRGPRQQYRLMMSEPVHMSSVLIWREGFPQWSPSCALVSDVSQPMGLSQCCLSLLGRSLV